MMRLMRKRDVFEANWLRKLIEFHFLLLITILPYTLKEGGVAMLCELILVNTDVIHEVYEHEPG
jgi:hypothetical protein